MNSLGHFLSLLLFVNLPGLELCACLIGHSFSFYTVDELPWWLFAKGTPASHCEFGALFEILLFNQTINFNLIEYIYALGFSQQSKQ